MPQFTEPVLSFMHLLPNQSNKKDQSVAQKGSQYPKCSIIKSYALKPRAILRSKSSAIRPKKIG